MHGWAEFGAWEERHEELLREAERGRLAHKAREGRVSARRAASRTEMPEGIEVRWGLLEDEATIADLLQLNGMPRWVAFEERYVVAERNGKILGALRYQTETKRLLLGLLVGDPWVEERPLAVALYAGAGELARDLGVVEVLAERFPHRDYPREAGYRLRGRREWRLELARSGVGREERGVGRWKRLLELFGVPAAPFVGLLRKQG